MHVMKGNIIDFNIILSGCHVTMAPPKRNRASHQAEYRRDYMARYRRSKNKELKTAVQAVAEYFESDGSANFTDLVKRLRETDLTVRLLTGKSRPTSTTPNEAIPPSQSQIDQVKIDELMKLVIS